MSGRMMPILFVTMLILGIQAIHYETYAILGGMLLGILIALMEVRYKK